MVPHFDYPVVDHPALPAFAAHAERFCNVIESVAGTTSRVLMSSLQREVSALYTAALDLPPTDVLYNEDEDEDEEDVPLGTIETARPLDPDCVSMEEWGEVHAALAGKLGGWTYYREIFDAYDFGEDSKEVHGSLADDAADIYRDVRSGLLKWKRGESGPALWEWRFGLESHWGDHATSAIRALHCWSAWHGGPLTS